MRQSSIGLVEYCSYMNRRVVIPPRDLRGYVPKQADAALADCRRLNPSPDTLVADRLRLRLVLRVLVNSYRVN